MRSQLVYSIFHKRSQTPCPVHARWRATPLGLPSSTSCFPQRRITCLISAEWGSSTMASSPNVLPVITWQRMRNICLTVWLHPPFDAIKYMYPLLTSSKHPVLEAVREGCHANLPNGVPFMLDPNKIFNTELLPPNSDIPRIDAPGKGKRSLKNLILIIVLPILGFLLLLICACGACVFCIHRRRRKAKTRNQPSYLHERWNDTGIMSPVHNHLHRSWGEPSPYQPEFTGPYAEYPNQTYKNAAEAPQDIKYPPEVYAMESPSQQYATVSPKTDMGTPKLYPPPPPRKSMNDWFVFQGKKGKRKEEGKKRKMKLKKDNSFVFMRRFFFIYWV